MRFTLTIPNEDTRQYPIPPSCAGLHCPASGAGGAAARRNAHRHKDRYGDALSAAGNGGLMATWKKRERQIAAYFGTIRTPLSGGNSAHTRSDSLHPDLFIEQKHRKSHSVISLWDKVKKLAKRENKIPVVTLTQHNRPGFWLVIHSDDIEHICDVINRKQKRGLNR